MRENKTIHLGFLFVISLTLFSSLTETKMLYGAEQQSVVFTLPGESMKTSECECSVEATGIGQAPQNKRPAQQRLLAERAAKVRAYRNLSQAVARSRSIFDSGLVRTSGFIQGAKVLEKRYLSNGKVLVRMGMELPYIAKTQNSCRAYLEHHALTLGYPVYVVDHTVEEITEDNWNSWN